MAGRMVGPGAAKSKFKGAMGGVKPKVNRPMNTAVKQTTANTPIQRSAPIGIKKPMKKF